MEWLKDKKNLPFVAGGSGLLIVAAIAFMLYSQGVFTPSAPTPAPLPERTAPAPVVASANVAGRPGSPRPTSSRPALGAHHPMMAARPGPGAPGAVPAKPAAPGAAAPVPGPPQNVNPAAASDPFDIPIIKNGKRIASAPIVAATVPLPRPRTLLPMKDYYSYGGDKTLQLTTLSLPPPVNGFPPPANAVYGTAMAALPRVAGVIFGNEGVHAILEYPNDQGQSGSVKPGDTIYGVGRVVSINNDGINVKPLSGRIINIPVTAGVSQTGGGFSGAPGGYSPDGPPPPVDIPGAIPGAPGGVPN